MNAVFRWCSPAAEPFGINDQRHCEERSDEAIPLRSTFRLIVTGLPRRSDTLAPRNDVVFIINFI